MLYRLCGDVWCAYDSLLHHYRHHSCTCCTFISFYLQIFFFLNEIELSECKTLPQTTMEKDRKLWCCNGILNCIGFLCTVHTANQCRDKPCGFSFKLNHIHLRSCIYFTGQHVIHHTVTRTCHTTVNIPHRAGLVIIWHTSNFPVGR